MGTPITKEKCEVCNQSFELPMQTARRGGYTEGDAKISLSRYFGEPYEDVASFSFDIEVCCNDCASTIAKAAKKALVSCRRKK
jgi:hypothetical protein